MIMRTNMSLSIIVEAVVMPRQPHFGHARWSETAHGRAVCHMHTISKTSP